MRSRQALSIRQLAMKLAVIADTGCAVCGEQTPHASAYQWAHTPTGAEHKAHDARTGRAVNPADLSRVAGITWDAIAYELTHHTRLLCATCHAVETAVQQGHAGIFTDINALRAFASECDERWSEEPVLLEWALWAQDRLADFG